MRPAAEKFPKNVEAAVCRFRHQPDAQVLKLRVGLV
jgi:hypothetical protein